MVWRIVSIDYAGGNHSTVLFSGDASKDLVNPTGPIGGTWILAVVGVGYLKMVDKGNTGGTIYYLSSCSTSH